MKSIELVYMRGPFGDETSNYDLKFEKGTTVQDVIDFALSRKKEWGTIWISGKKSRYKMEYRSGKTILDEIPDTIKSKRIERGFANGGWSLMSYDLTI